jgi:hypothetical protein
MNRYRLLYTGIVVLVGGAVVIALLWLLLPA